MRVEERFLKYVMSDTQSDENSSTVPSTPGQLHFADMLAEELRQLGAEDVSISKNGYVYAVIPSNIKQQERQNGSDKQLPTIGFIAHIDTADTFKGPSVQHPPQIFKNYDGKPLVLSSGIVIDPEQDENLKKAVGCDIITTDGATLLGGDDKAGVAEIMTAVEQLLHGDFQHGKIAVAFTPDEEIGTSMDNFDVKTFGADFAYTLDGAAFGEIEYENFNGASANVIFQGNTTHPGDAKGKMINASQLAIDFHQMLPQEKRPELTDGYDGFYHLMNIQGNCEKSRLSYIIREPDETIFDEMKMQMYRIADEMNEIYGDGTVNLKIEEDYANMAKIIEPHRHLLTNAQNAIEELGGEVRCGLIRGATDGANLSFMGVPCPNLGTGSYNHHSNREFANVQEMEKCTQLILKIAAAYSTGI